MAVTYEEARSIIREFHEARWTHGTFCLDDRTITETDDVYVFTIGAREFLVDGDESYEAIGGIPVVYKEDGRVASLPSVTVATDPTVRTRSNPNPTLEI
ncbi:hypothetical protein NE236_25240 [Actinoallomurus purpureus]|uniref:hypothetical protein n=1 Tax=Actinoallomurus purpureus TaxID=478114 RepID=UPI0020931BCF|nr:hypothetical protein [Actinoallomurus purpureus]MCO6008287.1 hypothetical protein [Actinoallomurus purpureus]